MADETDRRSSGDPSSGDVCGRRPGVLLVVGTPIGNLEDLSDRARRTLVETEMVAAEDTRRTGRLLRSLGSPARLISFFEGNEAERLPGLLDRLRQGHRVALVTDAGMPGVSDPGYRLVAACVGAGIPVDVVPGPSAVLTALVVSGLPTDRFVFEGFLPRSGRSRSERLTALATETRTIVLFESPRRVAATLRELAAACGDRRVVVARELTKLHQEILRGSLTQLAASLEDRELKGEVTIVVEGAHGGAPPDPAAALTDAMAIARAAVERGARKREASREAASATGLPAGEVYAALVGEAASSKKTGRGSSDDSRGSSSGTSS
jgi:16S rRNA (cytidine1402-2'-O)-methyltransferase